jgi:polysaccharide biosynthesis protein PelD
MAVKPPTWSPLLETGLFVGLTLVVDAVWGPGNRFAHVEPHPFWAIVLLMAVQYGTREALVAAAASSIALLAGNMPVQAFDQSVHEYAVQVLRLPLVWMIAAVVLGELRVRHRQHQLETDERLSHAERRVELLSGAHGDLTAAKERLETRLAGQLRTATGMFEAARALETNDPGQVLAGATDLVTVAMNAKAFSIFLLENGALVLGAAQGWSEDRELARRYTSNEPLFKEIVGAQRFVTVTTPVGESVLRGHGLIAGPLMCPSTGQLVGMLKIEDMTFLDFNLSTVHTFKALSEWIASAYVNATSAKANQIEDEKTQLYGMKFLDRQTAYITEIALRFGFDLTLLLVRIEMDGLTESERHSVPAALGAVAKRVLRRTDLVFSHEPPGQQFAVLLPGAPSENAGAVTRKLMEGLREACGRDIACTTRVRALCRATDSSERNSLRVEAAETDLVA